MKKNFIFILSVLFFYGDVSASGKGGAKEIWEVVEKCDVTSLRAFLSKFPGAVHMRHSAGKRKRVNDIIGNHVFYCREDRNLLEVNKGDTPLHFVMRHCKDPELVDALYECGADSLALNGDREVPLHNANEAMRDALWERYPNRYEMSRSEDRKGQTPMCRSVAKDDITGATFFYRRGVRDTCSELDESKKAMLHYLRKKFGK